jgi:hypothetical protein
MNVAAKPAGNTRAAGVHRPSVCLAKFGEIWYPLGAVLVVNDQLCSTVRPDRANVTIA